MLTYKVSLDFSFIFISAGCPAFSYKFIFNFIKSVVFFAFHIIFIYY